MQGRALLQYLYLDLAILFTTATYTSIPRILWLHIHTQKRSHKMHVTRAPKKATYIPNVVTDRYDTL